jgi:murein DD-endopeptidase MepM/ murein hydrolase activator NlpD
MKNKSFKIHLVLLLSILVAIPFFAAAQTSGTAPTKNSNSDTEIDELNQDIKQRRDHIKELEDTIATFKKEIEKKQTEAISLKNQISIVQSQLQKVQKEIELTNEKIATTQIEIKALEEVIADKNKNLSRQKLLLASMVRKIQSDDQRNALEILLTNESFADFYAQLQNLEQVNNDLGKSVQMLRRTKEDLENRKKQVEDRKKILENLKNELAANKDKYDEQVTYKTTMLDEAKSSEANFKTRVESLKKEYQITENQIRASEELVRKKLAVKNTAQPLPAGDVTFDWPVPSRYINSSFHDPDYPYRGIFEHTGLDIKASQGTAVRAAASGYVTARTDCKISTCLNYVAIAHTSSLSTRYLHLSSIIVDIEQFVNKGDIIGYSGAAPGTIGAGKWTTGPHLHFEVRLNGIPVDPLGYLIK